MTQHWNICSSCGNTIPQTNAVCIVTGFTIIYNAHTATWGPHIMCTNCAIEFEEALQRKLDSLTSRWIRPPKEKTPCPQTTESIS